MLIRVVTLIDISFLDLSILDILDVMIVGIMIYILYRLLKGTIAFNIIIGIILMYASWGLVVLLDMELLSSILGQFISVGFIALIIIFQPEIRRFLIYLGNTTLRGRKGPFARFFKVSATTEKIEQIEVIQEAVERMASRKIGALIVFPPDLNLEGSIEIGQVIKADISAELIVSIFQPKSPLHDGAMLIFGDKIHAVSCALVLSPKTKLPNRLGLRHKAGLSITEETASCSIIVSEETGRISFAYRGRLLENIAAEKLKTLLKQYYY